MGHFSVIMEAIVAEQYIVQCSDLNNYYGIENPNHQKTVISLSVSQFRRLYNQFRGDSLYQMVRMTSS